jgi:hypothetical protein
VEAAGGSTLQMMVDDSTPRYLQNLVEAYLMWYSRCVAT